MSEQQTTPKINKKLILIISIAVAVVLIIGAIIAVVIITGKKNGEQPAVTETTENTGTNTPVAIEDPYDYYGAHLIFEAENVNLLNIDGDSVNITLKVPAEWETENVNVCNSKGRKLQTIKLKELAESEELDYINGVVYRKFSGTMSVKKLTENSNRVYLKMGENRSNSVEFFKPIELSEQDVEVTFNTLCDLNDIVAGFEESEENVNVDDILSAAREYLKNSENVASISEQGNTIYFTMKNGMNSHISVDDMSEEYMASNGDSDKTADTTTDESSTSSSLADDVSNLLSNLYQGDTLPEERIESIYSEKPVTVNGGFLLESYLKKTQNPAEYISTINPNFLVMAPIRASENSLSMSNLDVQNGNAIETLSKSMSNALEKGNACVKTDDQCSYQTIQEWGLYGTVMLSTHGGNISIEGRNHGAVIFTMARSTNWKIFKDRISTDFLAQAKRWGISEDETIEDRWYDTRVYHGIKVQIGEYENDGINSLKSYSELLVTSDYIMSCLNNVEFENTVIVLDACQGLTDNEFNSFLLSKGASCVWGYDISINCAGSSSLLKKLDSYFLGVSEETEYSLSTNVLDENQVIVHWTELTYDWLENVLIQYMSNGEQSKPVTGEIILKCYKNTNQYVYIGYTELNGTVTDKLTGEPVKDAAITVYRYYNGKYEKYKSGKSDEEGKYVFEKMPFGIYTIRCDWGEEHVFINFSLGSLNKKTLDFQVTDYIGIYNFEDLKNISKNMSGKYVLMNDIVCDASYDYIAEGNVDFSGRIIGGGHTISNISTPLFKYIRKAYISDISLEIKSGVDVTRQMQDFGNYGPLCVSSYSSDIKKCSSKGAIVASLSEKVGGNIGGIVGHFEKSLMEECHSATSITLTSPTSTVRGGGLAGYCSSSTYIDCYNTGNIKVTLEGHGSNIYEVTAITAGGIVGEGSGYIEHCYNTGSVYAGGGVYMASKAGGIAGSGSFTVTRSWNSGSVTAYMPTDVETSELDSLSSSISSVGSKKEADDLRVGINNVNFMFWYSPPNGGYAGGIVGKGDIAFTDCYNSGAVNGSYMAGGIIGKTSNFNLENCVNVGSVTSNFCAGGFVGYLTRGIVSCSASNCYSTGAVTNAHIRGAFAGVFDLYSFPVEKCGYSTAAALDESLMIWSDESKGYSLVTISGVQSIASNPDFDFENVWDYDSASGTIALK